MVVEVYETHILIGSVSLLLGFIIARFYYKRIVRNVALGQVIDFSMIQNNVQNIEGLSSKLNDTISDMKMHTEELIEQIQACQDIEKSQQQSRFKENIFEEISDLNK